MDSLNLTLAVVLVAILTVALAIVASPESMVRLAAWCRAKAHERAALRVERHKLRIRRLDYQNELTKEFKAYLALEEEDRRGLLAPEARGRR